MQAGLLAPAALALLALALGPVLAHLARQPPRRQVRYGAMLLLERLARRLRRRRRLDDRWLLLLRVLAVALAALAAARPELRWPAANAALDGVGAVVVVLDDSLSMDLVDGAGPARETLFERARREAVAFVRDLPQGTRVGLVTVGGAARAVTPELTADRDAVAAAIEALRQGPGSTDLAGALALARRMLAGTGGAAAVFTDEAGPVAVPAAASEIALFGEQGLGLIPRPVRARDPANLVILGATYGEGLEGGSVRLTVANYGAADREAPLTVELPDGAEIHAFVDVPAGGTAEERVTVPRVAEGGVALARVDDERLRLDDAYAFQLPRVGASRVLVVDGDPGPTPTASEVYFLERALAPWGAAAALEGGVLPDVASEVGAVDLDPEVHRVAFLANVSDPGPLAARLLAFVRAGGGLVIGVGDNVTAERYNEPLALLLPSPLRRAESLAAPGENGVPTELPDVSLELFRPFARGGRAAFGRVRWRRLFTLQPYEDSEQVRTLMRTASGLPLLVERRLGQGRVLLFTGTFDLGWGDFPLQAAFMPWVQRLVTYLGGETGGGGLRLEGRVGEAVRVDLPDAALDVSVRGPDGPVAVRVRGGQAVFTPELPGAYVVETPGAPPLAWVAIHTDPAESDVRLTHRLVETAARVDPERFVHHEPLWPWLLWAALGFAVLQAALAAALGRRAAAEEVSRAA